MKENKAKWITQDVQEVTFEGVLHSYLLLRHKRPEE